ncbi:MAG: tetraacyldisaccharide 4'-kinase [Paracoccaceae bacterium]|jgi:tetraacyldisaccharide 4'-kinase|nr:MAG: tetraacyldisaccharide 4'-kinase [Rhodobacter sp. BACL10 MAG-120910-bin24]KRO90144.1 MAG: tetraacyldisaccharide 4'-kinase [Rhodobacter sp. BACL10 MAG-121220-bin24]KRP22984.1 MAG: tetraacyldisaccharide 4'-kinase [Rhodobacter sp. BACL10 MAG-120419-bin15]MDP5322900.1 tetraacyldisaccharide 4'-kinase [Paracoccaceae bacterium]HCB53822.1 tetraacyldisaccharide 4'-kinase [Rhodobacter sp.]
MQAPKFWYQKAALAAWALSPLGWIYGCTTAARVKKRGLHAQVPVICVGNLNIGGTGKTPFVSDLAQRLLGAQIVSRGYGGRVTGPVLVDLTRHTAADVGDEPLLLAAFAPTWVAKNRAAAVEAAQASGARVILMDDGFQNATVSKDLSILVVDAKRGFGNGFCLPAGPLREPISAGLKRADLLVLIGTPLDGATFLQRYEITIPYVQANLQPLATGMTWQGARVMAFAGIGHPEKFFTSLRDVGANIIDSQALDDHQPLTESLMVRLSARAKAASAQLVTTEKDAVRLPKSWQGQVLTLPVRLQFLDEEPLAKVLQRLSL